VDSLKSEQTTSVKVSHRYNATPERVYDAWLDPKLIGQWMFGQVLRDEEVLHIELDPKIGGTFSFLVRRQGVEIDHIGTYQELKRPRRLVFTWGIAGLSTDESRVIIEIVPQKTGCELTLIHELHPKWAEFADSARNSWTIMLDALAKTLNSD
jgi:uncharacterized protein YndB with AHSA1/START domain